ncbi:hypothetical protein AB0C33_35870 [Nonomuraea sp. NPDC048881]|uniref:hypothetical protein n=1 Tax=Nonomuraea sp. NPDC048881 TaxID=3155030 RepID=UPI0033DFAC67
MAYLADRVRSAWCRITSTADAPSEPPPGDEDAVEVYFAFRSASGADESYSLTTLEVTGPPSAYSAGPSMHP